MVVVEVMVVVVVVVDIAVDVVEDFGFLNDCQSFFFPTNTHLSADSPTIFRAPTTEHLDPLICASTGYQVAPTTIVSTKAKDVACRAMFFIALIIQVPLIQKFRDS